MNINKILHWCSFLTILIAIGISIYAWYLLFYPFNPMEYQYTTLPVLEKRLRHGDKLAMKISYCRNTDLPAITYRTFVNTVLVSLPPIESRSARGCNELISNATVIPDVLPIGKAHFEIVVQIKVNPLRTISYELKTEEFEIIDATLSAK